MCGLVVDAGSSLSLSEFESAVKRLAHRGPDQTVILALNREVKFGFTRLAIMDPTLAGQQPFVSDDGHLHAVCNGEIYNFRALKAQLTEHSFHSGSDCEVLLPLFERDGMEGLVQQIEGEYALVIYDSRSHQCLAARDPIGIRPLFYGLEKYSGRMLFASEAKAIHPYCTEVHPFPPGHYFDGKKFVQFVDASAVSKTPMTDEAQALKEIRERLIEGVRSRLDADVPLGALLSGGLDSSLVCAIATKILGKPITTFAVGLYEAPIDIKYARQVADFIGSNHHEVYFDMDEAIAGLDALIAQLETWDITTVRASVGMSLVCKYVREKTPIRVLLTGEVSDELFGYKYTDFAPSPQEFEEESQKRIRELYAYDVLRADRSIAFHGLEARVPFSDLKFVQSVMGIAPQLKMNTHAMGKWILRQAFVGTGLLPDPILWREKAAFSDAVGHGLVEQLKAHAEKKYSDSEFAQKSVQYSHGTPISKEALLYREIFERHYPGRADWIPAFWLPNPNWVGCNVKDPSARVLANYGQSGA